MLNSGTDSKGRVAREAGPQPGQGGLDRRCLVSAGEAVAGARQARTTLGLQQSAGERRSPCGWGRGVRVRTHTPCPGAHEGPGGSRSTQGCSQGPQAPPSEPHSWPHPARPEAETGQPREGQGRTGRERGMSRSRSQAPFTPPFKGTRADPGGAAPPPCPRRSA